MDVEKKSDISGVFKADRKRKVADGHEFQDKGAAFKWNSANQIRTP